MENKPVVFFTKLWLAMSQKSPKTVSKETGPKTVKKQTELGMEDVIFSTPTGERSREETITVAFDGLEGNPLEVIDTAEPAGSDEMGREEKAVSGQEIQLGQRSKCDGDIQHEDVVEATTEISPFQCIICSVSCTSEKDYNTHVSGKRHARALTAVVSPRPSKVQKLGAGSEANLSSPSVPVDLHECMSMEPQVLVNGSITGKCCLTSCTGGRDLQGANLLFVGTSVVEDVKDVIMEKQDAVMATPGADSLKDDSHPIFKDRLNGPMSGDGGANCILLDFGGCKHNSDCVTQALAMAFEVCGGPGVKGLTRSTGNQLRAPHESVAAGIMSSTTPGMLAMHAHCFMNFVRELQVKAIDNLLDRLARDERARAFTSEAWLPSNAMNSVILPGEKDTNCLLCNVEYTSRSDLDLHVAGKKHSSMVKRLHLRCHLCNVQSNSEKDLEVHMNGKKHASKMRVVQKGVLM